MEAERPRALSNLVAQSLAQKKARPLEIAPLSAPIAPLTSFPLTQQSSPGVSEATRTHQPPALTSGDLRAMLATSSKLREIALLTELLQPPVALRRPRRFR
jgi:hypothetical protein